MTVAVNDTIERYTITGAGPYAYTWRIFNDTDLQVYALSSASPPVPAPLTYLTHYTVAGANDAAGGSITLTAAAIAAYAGYTLDIRANTPENQPTSIRNQARFLPEIHEDAFDYLSRQIQDLNRRVNASIQYPDNEVISGVVEPATARKGFYLVWDSITGALTKAAISTVTMTQSIIGQLLNPQTAAEAAVGVVPTNYWYAAYNLLRYGANGNNVAINNTAIASWKAACDQADAEGVIPEGQFKINAQVEFPRKVRCYGSITGNFEVLYQLRDDGWINSLVCYDFRLRGCRFCTITNLLANNNVNIDGYDLSRGVFWCEFIRWHVEGTLTIDITNWAVNDNTWRGGRIDTTLITGNLSIYATTQAHANSFDGVDFTNGGILQNDAANQVNFLRGVYYEGGANIVGNFHIWGYQGDGEALPATKRFTHIMGAVGLNQKICRDFLSLTVHNAARGGNWDWLDASGKPPCIANSGGAGPAVVVDTSEPGGVGKRYEATFSGAFTGFVITMQPNGTDRFGIDLYYRSTGDFAAIESNDGSGALSLSPIPVVIDVNWKKLRISGKASPTATTIITLFAYGGGGGAAKVMAIGSVFAGGERAVLSPHKNQDYESGRYTPVFTGVTNIAASTAYPWQFSRNGNTVNFSGRVDIDPTLAAPTASEIGFSLPIAPTTAFSLADQCMGAGVSENNSQVGIVYADAANNRGTFRFRATNVANDSWGITGSYRMG